MSALPLRKISVTVLLNGKGTYNDKSNSGGEGKSSLYLDWEDEDGTRLQFSNRPSGSFNLNGNCKETITSITEDRVKGTFSGTLYLKDGEKAVIEDGKFNVKMKKYF